jgi:hypothetical protein
MNRHEPRAAGASARGAAWMRWQAWQASDADSIVMHPKGQSPRGQPDDIRLSAAYGAIKFKAFVAPQLLA